jgi:vacuolar-type H+-ATPase subunit I/STV1
MKTRDELVQALKDQIDALNKEVDELEAKARETSDAVEGEIAKQREKLEEQRAHFVERFADAKDAGDEAWEELKDEAEHALKAFRNSVNYFKSHFS